MDLQTMLRGRGLQLAGHYVECIYSELRMELYSLLKGSLFQLCHYLFQGFQPTHGVVCHSSHKICTCSW